MTGTRAPTRAEARGKAQAKARAFAWAEAGARLDLRRLGHMLLVAAFALTGVACSSASDPAVPHTTAPQTTTASPTPSPPATPTLPATATATQRGAEVFVRYFWDVFNYTYASGDTKLLRSISGSSCSFCRSTGEDVDALTREGSRTQGGRVTVFTVTAPPGDPETGFPVFTLVAQSPGTVLSESGDVLGSSPAIAKRRSDVRVRWSAGHWAMDGVSFGGPQ